jgi:hypothetical protein
MVLEEYFCLYFENFFNNFYMSMHNEELHSATNFGKKNIFRCSDSRKENIKGFALSQVISGSKITEGHFSSQNSRVRTQICI